jgi:hypothetical protein
MKKNMQLIRVIKRIYLQSSEFFLPVSNIIKYPIFLDNLKGRIQELQEKYSLSKGWRVYDLSFGVTQKISSKGTKGERWCIHTVV